MHIFEEKVKFMLPQDPVPSLNIHTPADKGRCDHRYDCDAENVNKNEQ